ncbi:hypothetical protein RFI_15881 [Reticulomyxa filosa]|uniref:Helicase C-terminal domain-containing protein n=1 Tax=Reticulomyxa filosa TaxID=46433 RepID=X6N4W3_RETFI|nr:hypothetical protein RFI_15881 [Reticulomyxa filosa]|eukprot:ETO21320.1 hypothetical protein RFI_15881 [Reticulomyxa filosa]
MISENEKKLVMTVFTNAINTLSDENKQLLQLTGAVEMLQRGVGIHHAGLLPILKEVIEILFAEGLIKVLIATETFAMGVNFPTKTVIFSSIRKWDGHARRFLTSGEYVQMSGRAGRRGLDTRGIVIMYVDEYMQPEEVTEMLKGQTDRLVSEFRLTYPMVIQLLRMADVSPTYLLQRSFMHFQALERTPELTHALDVLQQEEKELIAQYFCQDQITDHNHHVVDLQKMAEFCSLQSAWTDLSIEFQREQCQIKFLLPWLNPGRLLFVSQLQPKKKIWGWGICLRFKKSDFYNPGSANDDEDLRRGHVVDVLLPCHRESPDGPLQPISCKEWCQFILNPTDWTDGKTSSILFRTISVTLHSIARVSIACVNIPSSMHLHAQREGLAVRLFECLRALLSDESNKKSSWLYTSLSTLDCERIQDEHYQAPYLHPISDLRVPASKIKATMTKMEQLQESIRCHDVSKQLKNGAKIKEYVMHFQRKQELDREISKIQQELDALQNNEHIMSRLKGMEQVLEKLQLIDSKQHTVTLKGRIACELSCADELVLTELLFTNILPEMKSPAHVNALLSCFVTEAKVYVIFNVFTSELKNAELEKYHLLLTRKVQRIAKICKKCKLEIYVNQYKNKFSWLMMEPCFAWTNGSKFQDIITMTILHEGSIVRVIHRLFELLNELIHCSHIMGNEQLAKLFEQCQKLIKRDIIFAPSLYLG